MNDRPAPASRKDYRWFTEITTRWHDNDVYGHVNNVVYYAWFDTVVNRYLMEAGVLAPQTNPAIGLVVETGCTYFESVSFPETVEAGMRVSRLGRSSVEYAVAVFKAGQHTAAAQGRFVHVYVDRISRRPTPLPANVRKALEPLAGAVEDP
jgi:acyl-CoA thioester hydrolase